MDKYSELIRTTIGEYLSLMPYTGPAVYVIACYPAFGCVYVGKSDQLAIRIRQHIAQDDMLGKLLSSNMADTCGWRLDILVPPAGDVQWVDLAEQRLVEYFRPLVNTKMELAA